MTLGGGVKALGRHVEQDARPGQPLGHHRQPAIGLGARFCNQPQRHLTLKHQGQPREFADPAKPAEQQDGGDIVGQVGDDLARRRRQCDQVESQRVARDEFETPGIGRGKLAQRRQAARVALDRDDMAGTGVEQRAG